MRLLVCVESTGDKFEEGEQLFMTSMSPVGSAFATNKRGEELSFFPSDKPAEFYCSTVGGSKNDPKYLFELQEA